MQYEYITTDSQLRDFCEEISGAKVIAFDTEFVSEDSYRPDLCLVQVAAGGRLFAIDPYSVGDITPFWELLASGGHETIAHAGREELRFSLHAVGARPHRLFDIQIAAAFVGLEYPAAYGKLVSRLLRKTLDKGETRTNWRHRPLSKHQLEYAMQDVLYLEKIRNILGEKLEKLGRQSWLETEMEAWQSLVEDAESSRRWRRVSGISGLSSRCLAVVRRLWQWRDEQAQRRNQLPKRILRDDLIVELAKRQTSDLKRIRAVRGLERGNLQQHLPDLAACIDEALSLPDDQCPKRFQRDTTPQLNLLAQFLNTALGSICRAAQIAPGIVGTTQDVRELIAYRLNIGKAAENEPPSLATGWRAEIVGQRIDDLLSGKVSIRITDPLSDHPLSFDEGSP